MDAQVRKIERCPKCGSPSTRQYSTPRRVFRSGLVPSGLIRYQYRVCLSCEGSFRVLLEVVEPIEEKTVRVKFEPRKPA